MSGYGNFVPVGYTPKGGRLERAGLGGIMRSCLHVGYLEPSEGADDERYFGTAFWVHWRGGVRYLVFATHEVRNGKLLMLDESDARRICGESVDVGVVPVGSVEIDQVRGGLCDGITVFRDGNEGFDRNEIGELKYVKYGMGDGLYVGCEVYLMGYAFGENYFVDKVDGEERTLPLLVRGILSGWSKDRDCFLIDSGQPCGFSGGPVCYFDGTNWNVFGVIAGMFVEMEKKEGFTVAMNLERAFGLFDRYVE